MTATGAWSVVQRIDEDNTGWLARIIENHGWSGRVLGGVDGAHATWLIAEQASPEHRAAWLDLLQTAVDSDDARARDLAFSDEQVNARHAYPKGGPRSPTAI